MSLVKAAVVAVGLVLVYGRWDALRRLLHNYLQRRVSFRICTLTYARGPRGRANIGPSVHFAVVSWPARSWWPRFD